MKHLTYLTTILCLVTLCAGCTKHDPSYDDVMPPVITFSHYSITGLVTDLNGAPIQNAVIRLSDGTTCTTDKDGYYSFDLSSAGEFEISASADGMVDRSKEAVLDPSLAFQNIVVNFILLKIPVEVVFQKEAQIETDVIEHNDKGIVSISATIETEDPEAEYKLSAFYDRSQINDSGIETKTIVKDEVLFGYVFSQTKGDNDNTASFSISLNKDSQARVKVKTLKNGVWVDFPYESYDEEIKLKGVTPGYYGVFCDIDKTESSTFQDLKVEPKQIDNLYGEEPLDVTSLVYSYTTGVEIDVYQGKDQFKALLLEKLAYDYGLTSLTKEYIYPVDFIIPVGAAVDILAKQQFKEITYTNDGKSVHGYIFGTASVRTSTYNRQHTGGGN